MLKLRLAIALGILLALTFSLTATLVVGTQHVDYQFKRSHYAQNSLSSQLQLIDAVEQYFNQQLTSLLLQRPNPSKTKLTREDLLISMQQFRKQVLEEQQFLISHHQYSLTVNQELEQLQKLLHQCIDSVESAQQLVAENQYQLAISKMASIHEQLLEGELRPLLNQLAERKQRQSDAAAAEEVETTSQLIDLATVFSELALLAAIIIGIYLYRAITRPLTHMMEGATAIRDGHLGFQIKENGPEEFRQLAAQFNNMSETLYIQHCELVNINSNLEEQVQLRTLELQKANASLKRIDEMRTAFFEDISHELRTPLTIIRGEAEVTLRGKQHSDKDYRDVLAVIIELTTQLNRLVDDLFYLSKAESGSINYSNEVLNLTEVVTECRNEVANKALNYHLNFNSSIDQCHRYIGDRGRLKQLVHILLDNACRYNKPNGDVELNLTSCDDYATITVHDSGVGIPEDELESVFERHYRGKSAQSLAKEGGGLGLPMAMAIVKSHDGDIRIQSRAGEGTTVSVKLPYSSTR